MDVLTAPLLSWKEVPAWVGGWGKATGRRELRKGISVEPTGNGSSRGWGWGARKAATGGLLQGCELGCVAGIITYCIETTSIFITVSTQPQSKIKIFIGLPSLLEIQAAKGLLS